MDTPPLKYNILQPLLLASCMAVGMMAGYKLNDLKDPGLVDIYAYPEEKNGEVGTVEELIRFIENRYIDTIHRDLLTEDAIRAVFSRLDPYSDYLSPGEFEDYGQRMDGTFRGVGIEIQKVKDTFYVRHVIPGSSASKQGIKIFDKLLTVNGDTLLGEKRSIEEIGSMIGQKVGMSVELTIQREGKKLHFDLTTEDLAVPTVHAEWLPEIKTCFVKIDYFARGTYREFMQAIEPYFENGRAKHLILDLRGNPGGYIPEATNVLCQIFEEKEKILFTTKNRSHKTYEYKSTGKQFFEIDQVVVLIDSETASASEIVAGSVQDWDRGIIIGAQSYGKGLVQEQYPLKNGGSLRLSVEKYYLPSGRSIQKPSHLSANVLQNIEGAIVSEPNTTIQNGTEYKTLIRGRKVEAFSGIIPDIQVDNGVSSNELDAVNDILNTFVFAYLTQYKDDLPKDRISLQSWQIPADVYTRFSTYLKEETGIDRIPESWHRSAFFEAFKEEVSEILFKKQDTDVLNGEKDPFLRAAILAIQEKKAVSATK